MTTTGVVTLHTVGHTPLKIGEWNYIVMTFWRAVNRVELFVNGWLDMSGGAFRAELIDLNIPGDFWIGKDLGWATPFFGVIDEVIVHGRLLTATEIRARYEEMVLLKPPTIVTLEAENVGETSAVLVGRLLNLGGFENASVWFEYRLEQMLWMTTPEFIVDNVGIVRYTIDNLIPNRVYGFRVKARNPEGVGDGVERMFTTLRVMPRIIGERVVTVGIDKAVVEAYVSLGDFDNGMLYFVIDDNEHSVFITEDGTYTHTFENLRENTAYTWRIRLEYDGMAIATPAKEFVTRAVLPVEVPPEPVPWLLYGGLGWLAVGCVASVVMPVGKRVGRRR
jgi:hypothetical protein